MREVIRENAKRCLLLLVSPIARFCLKHSIGFREFSEIAKAVFIETAAQELKRKSIPVSASRISLMTGLQRRDATRQRGTELISEQRRENSLATRIIGQWATDARFLDKKGKPRILSIEGKTSEFAELVRTVSTDPNTYSVLFELERIGAVERQKDGIRLVLQTYIPRADLVSGYELLATDCSDLICAVEENLLNDLGVRNLHSTTTFDNIDPKDVPHIKKFLLRYGSNVHARVRQFLARYDRDTAKTRGANSASKSKQNSSKNRTRVIFSTFSLSQDASSALTKYDDDE